MRASAGVLAANYPFATKDPNVGVVSVPRPARLARGVASRAHRPAAWSSSTSRARRRRVEGEGLGPVPGDHPRNRAIVQSCSASRRRHLHVMAPSIRRDREVIEFELALAISRTARSGWTA